jgi:hypothetical protein
MRLSACSNRCVTWRRRTRTVRACCQVNKSPQQRFDSIACVSYCAFTHDVYVAVVKYQLVVRTGSKKGAGSTANVGHIHTSRTFNPFSSNFEIFYCNRLLGARAVFDDILRPERRQRPAEARRRAQRVRGGTLFLAASVFRSLFLDIYTDSIDDLWQAGRVDEFEFDMVELGTIQRLLIQHDNSGLAAGWYCDSITVRPRIRYSPLDDIRHHPTLSISLSLSRTFE